MRMQCAELSDKLSEDLASEGLKGKTITLKLKETNFEQRTRDKTLASYISSKDDIFREAMKLLRLEMPIKIRLMVSPSPEEAWLI
jgi:DNA polymerase kappa